MLWFNTPDRLAIDRCEAFISACRTVFSIDPTFDTWHNNQTMQGQLFSVMKGIKCTDKTADDFLDEAKAFVTRRFYDCAGDPHMQVKCKVEECLNECEYFYFIFFRRYLNNTEHFCVLTVLAFDTWIKQHSNAFGATLSGEANIKWTRYVAKLIETFNGWVAAEKLGNFDLPTLGVSGTNVSDLNRLHLIVIRVEN